MRVKNYEKPDSVIVPMSFQEDVCLDPSGGVPNYTKVTDFEWEDE